MDKKMKYDVDELIEMLDYNQPIQIQKIAIEYAKKIKNVMYLCKPPYGSMLNAAKVLSSKSDSELEPALQYMFEMIKDIQMPGALIIEERLRKYDHDNENFKKKFIEAQKNADDIFYRNELYKLYLDELDPSFDVNSLIKNDENKIKYPISTEMWFYSNHEFKEFNILLSIKQRKNLDKKIINEYDLFIEFNHSLDVDIITIKMNKDKKTILNTTELYKEKTKIKSSRFHRNYYFYEEIEDVTSFPGEYEIIIYTNIDEFEEKLYQQGHLIIN